MNWMHFLNLGWNVNKWNSLQWIVFFYPSSLTSWALTSNWRLFFCKKLWVTSGPNEIATPLLLGDLPGNGWGSLHIISHINPSSGGCRTLFIFDISSKLTLSYPNSVHLLRGNHEALTMNKMYGFQGEVYLLYSYLYICQIQQPKYLIF